MILKEVQVVAPVGTRFGTVKGENGVLTIVVKPPGETEWPHGTTPDGGFNEIEPGFTRYVVMDDATTKEEPSGADHSPPPA